MFLITFRFSQCFYFSSAFVATEMPTEDSDETLEGAVGGEIEHHTSQEQTCTDLESDSKGDVFQVLQMCLLHCSLIINR